MDLKIGNYFSRLSLEFNDARDKIKTLKKREQVGIVALSILAGFLTFGLGGVVTFNALVGRCKKGGEGENSTTKKSAHVASEHFSESGSSRSAEGDDLKNFAIPKTVNKPKTRPEQILAVSNDIHQNRVELFLRASKNEDEFINLIRDKFKEKNLSFSEIATNQEAIGLFLGSSLLRPALVKYAKANKLQQILDKHLAWISNLIFEIRDELIPDKESIPTALSLIDILFSKEGRLLSELLRPDSEALEIFMKSSRLKLILFIYIELKKNKDEQPQTKVSPDEDKARELGRKLRLAGEGGLVTQLNLQDVDIQNLQNNPHDLKKELNKLKLKHHPDKNPGNEDEAAEKFKLIKELQKLLEAGVIDQYLSEYNKNK